MTAEVYKSMNVDNDIPVVLITYNRPKHTSTVLNVLRENNIQNLYVYSDGPKTPEHAEAVFRTREIIRNIKWTNPKYTYRDSNIGLAKSVTSAVNEVFSEHDRLILLEDDCVPQEYFFDFMREMLNQYEYNKRIFGISGYTIPIPDNILSDYLYDIYFFPRIGSWGWATWRDRWSLYNDNLESLILAVNKSKIDTSQGGNDIKEFVDYLSSGGKVGDIWTIKWILTNYLYNGVYIYPTKSLISNIGFDGSGVHCNQSTKFASSHAERSLAYFPADVFFDNEIINHFKCFYDTHNSPLENYQENCEKHNLQTDPGNEHRLKLVGLLSEVQNNFSNLTFLHRIVEELIILKMYSHALAMTKMILALEPNNERAQLLKIRLENEYN